MTLADKVLASQRIENYVALAKIYIESLLPPELEKFKSLIAPVKNDTDIDMVKNVPFYVYKYRELQGWTGFKTYVFGLDLITNENADVMTPYIEEGMSFHYFDLITAYSGAIGDFKRLHLDFNISYPIIWED